ncbi:hypothetical protein H7X68_00175 [Candidatus Saccharibacteria bacterium]|nr:hypothetical protein [Candidatus Saccharibacteria bacterium]
MREIVDLPTPKYLTPERRELWEKHLTTAGLRVFIAEQTLGEMGTGRLEDDVTTHWTRHLESAYKAEDVAKKMLGMASLKLTVSTEPTLHQSSHKGVEYADVSS